jgi:O-antigen polymerase
MSGLWGCIILYCVLLQCNLSERQKTTILYFIAIAGLVQSVYVITESNAPRHLMPPVAALLLKKYGRSAVGVFQQVNVTASFLAMTLGVMLLLLGKLPARHTHLARCKRISLALGIVLTTAVLVFLRSRTGWIGGIIAVVGINALWNQKRFRSQNSRPWVLLYLPLLGVLIGYILLNTSFSQVLEAHAGSNTQRILTLKYTIQMILNGPFFGHGAGSFEAVYQNYLACLPGGNPGKEMMNYPHNELLYQAFEGGVIALLGSLLLVVVWFQSWLGANNSTHYGTLICMLPILLHTQLEYPLYYSVAHDFVLTVLLAMAATNCKTIRVNKYVTFLIFSFVGTFMLYGSLITFKAYSVERFLWRFETGAETQPENITSLNAPWILKNRWDHDLSLLRLIRFKTVPDTGSLQKFTYENQLWLTLHADSDMYYNQIAVLHYLRDSSQEESVRDKARKMFPWDKRFK